MKSQAISVGFGYLSSDEGGYGIGRQDDYQAEDGRYDGLFGLVYNAFVALGQHPSQTGIEYQNKEDDADE